MKKNEVFTPAKERVWPKVYRTYMMTGFYGTLLIFVPSLLITPYLLRNEDYLTLLFFTITWTGITLPLLALLVNRLHQRTVLSNMVALLSCVQLFSPRSHQVKDTIRGQYFGLDTDHGTLLYIRNIQKDLIDIVALTINDWVKCEREDGYLRIHTRLTDLPLLCVYDHPASAALLAETLWAMRHRRYPEHLAKSWPEYVRRQSHLILCKHKVIVP